jgi:hypothetical protein
MTQQRADILAEFYTGAAAGKAASFRCRKDPSTLTDYFRVWQQLLAYYWRVVVQPGEDQQEEDSNGSSSDSSSDSSSGSSSDSSGRKRQGYFTASQPEQQPLPNTLQPTSAQAQATRAVLAALVVDPQEEGQQQQLQHAVQRLSLALICQQVGSTPFTSPILSFCAMLSRTAPRKPRQEGASSKGAAIGAAIGAATTVAAVGQGLWQEPGNFNHYLSALT